MNTCTNEHVKTDTWRIGLVFFLAVTAVTAHLGVAFAAPPGKADSCTRAVTRVAAAWPDLLRKIDKRTVDETARAATAGSDAFKTGLTLLVILAKHARATGNEGDLAIAQVVDSAVTELKVVAPTTAAIAAWARANQACDQVKLLAGDPDSVCESAGLDAKVQAACKSCDRATATMESLAAGTPAGQHGIDELIEAASDHAGSALDGLADGGVADHPRASALASSLTRHLNTLKHVLKDALESSSAGGIAWDMYDTLKGGTDGQGAPSKLADLPAWTQASLYAKAVTRACGTGQRLKAKAVKAASEPTGEPLEPDPSCAFGACPKYGYCGKGKFFGCGARDSRDCVASDVCKNSGRCTAADGECRKLAGADGCSTWDGCLSDGECINVGGICVASTEGCRASSRCKKLGKCGLRGSSGTARAKCQADSDEDCEQSENCAKRGACTLSGGDAHCTAGGSDTCRRSEMCRERGDCSFVNYYTFGLCRPTSAADCKGTTACRERGMCNFTPTEYRAGLVVDGCCSAADGVCTK